MPRGRRPNPPVPRPSILDNQGWGSRISDNPAVDSTIVGVPSSEVADLIAHNREHIDLMARMSAIQGMPIILAQGHSTCAGKKAEDLVRTIESLIRQAIDKGAGNAQDQCGVFSVEVWMARMSEEGYSDRAKNRNVLDIDITIPLENALMTMPPQHYTKLAKKFSKWFGDED